MAAYTTPCGRILPLALANTVYSVWTLLQAHATPPISEGLGPRCQWITLQFPYEVGAVGSAGFLFIGTESTMTNANYMAQIVPSQFYPIPSLGANWVRLDHLWVMADTATQYVAVGFLQT